MPTHLKGDATKPTGPGPKLIAHICNDIGVWGAGFVMALSAKWPAPERLFRKTRMGLGSVQYVPVTSDITVANMIAQHGVGGKTPPIRYSALEACLANLNEEAELLGATVHGPKFGAGLAGGDWDRIEQILKKVMTVPVYIYTL